MEMPSQVDDVELEPNSTYITKTYLEERIKRVEDSIQEEIRGVKEEILRAMKSHQYIEQYEESDSKIAFTGKINPSYEETEDTVKVLQNRDINSITDTGKPQ